MAATVSSGIDRFRKGSAVRINTRTISGKQFCADHNNDADLATVHRVEPANNVIYLMTKKGVRPIAPDFVSPL